MKLELTGQRVRLRLSTGFAYAGKVLDEDEEFITIRDGKLKAEVLIRTSTIISVEYIGDFYA